jgi:glutamine synthetase
MSAANVMKMIKENDVKYVDFRFCDTRGKEQHVTFPAHSIDEGTFEEGKINCRAGSFL